MKKLKLAIVYDAIYPFVKGGTEKRNYEISKRFAKLGYDVHLYGMKWWEGENIIVRDGVTIHGICKALPLYTTGGRRSIVQAFYFGLNCLKLIREDFDILDVNHMPFFSLLSAGIVARLKKKKLHATWNEVWGKNYWREYLGMRGYIAYIIERLSVSMPDTIITVSHHTKTKLKKELNCTKIIHVIPNGIDIHAINRIKPAKQKSDVIYAGRLLSHKNIHFLINSIYVLKDAYPNITCVIVGKGPEELMLKKMVKNLGLQKNVLFYDFVEQAEVLYSLLKSSKVFAFPSTREGFGMAALEANASGIPFVTTDHKDNATKDLIKNGKNGVSVPLNEKSIAENVKRYLTVSGTPVDYIEIVQEYDWDRIVKQIEEVYKSNG